ncbi:MAG: Gfo/Idh/MocA family oxidoreductase [Kiritimatiellaeota bacterium]|nr:Gfo/Idh/MocA family oxidoreductase [Kiritimatiellota bacterium]
MKGENVNVGVIGVGAFMARQHLPNMLRNPKIKIHALCDVNEELLKQRAGEFSPEITTTNDKDIFENPDIDAVMVGTRSQLHAHYVLKAIEYGKHVFVEKPMTMSYEETREVMNSVEKSNIYQKSFSQRPDQNLSGEHAANDFHMLKVDKGHDASIFAFAQAIATGEQFAINAVDGARATICALKAYESIEKNIPVAIDPSEYGVSIGKWRFL